MIGKVIEQLDRTVYDKLEAELEETKAAKMLTLLRMFREGVADSEINAKALGISAQSFYTLKSRLQDKVQHVLFRNTSDEYAELLKNLSSIPYLINNTPRETAVLLLLYLEQELIRKDKPGELAQVYGSLKKLHALHPDYFHYEQLYNKNIAYFLAFEKTEETLTRFNTTLAQYLMSGDVQLREMMKLYIKELNNLSRLYQSHRIRIYKGIAEVSFALFAEHSGEINGSEQTVQDILSEMEEKFTDHADDPQYRFLKVVWHFLNFEYFSMLGLNKNAQPSFEALIDDRCRVLFLSHTAVTGRFLLTGFRRLADLKDIENRMQEWPADDPHNIYGRINRALFRSGILFEQKKFQAAASVLNDCLNDVSFRNIFHAECAVRIFYILSLAAAEKTDLAETQLRSLTRKIAGLTDKEILAPATQEWLTLLKMILAGKDKTQMQKAADALKPALKNPSALLRHVQIESDAMKSIMR